MDLMEKLTVLTNSAKYDVACTSSGADRPGKTVMAGCCHSFAADGRCVTLLKVLMTNFCIYDCTYCVNRVSNDCQRTAFTPAELAELTIEFYRRNYIEGLFLSSGVIKSPDYTMEQMIKALEILRYRHNFWGYVHAKVIPGASPYMVHRIGLLADRLSVNIELPSESSLRQLAPNKEKKAILAPMQQISIEGSQSRQELVIYKKAPKFAPAGQATQMIIGASPETDYQILNLASAMYKKYSLKRVFYSAYIPAVEHSLLPAPDTKPPLLREHRLYQADWLLRQYGFGAEEILTPETPNFNPYLDPKCNWAINNMHLFPVDVNRARLDELLRVPGIGPTSARRIVTARKNGRLGIAELKRMGTVLKRAQYFINAADWIAGAGTGREAAIRALIDPKVYSFGPEQLSLFQENPGIQKLPSAEDVSSVAEAVEETVLCLRKNL
ncbi:putative DNA modification/repair radical SAM protein [Brucepastera parasyntrophica]|uniref:putative DNA modification/repair radical SAM protein n=1 Tax=Brucepastera parasyntrophica TaxID=2880008 RepID=UPI00210BF93E|nr:putative DNA modification/repair radical SAM protein [Brucepastera parasyntrophica]ULQ60451.1 putative DNA modification/repair radical SAM protein [Brucepastera parasyntrophica]